MIFITPIATSAATPVATTVAAHSVSNRFFTTEAPGGTPQTESMLTGGEGDSVSPRLEKLDIAEKFDWSAQKLQREFIRLEQLTLAQKASDDEQLRYAAMKPDRNSLIFADRYVRDYAEIQRLRKLSEKLAEVEQFLRPINI